MLNIMNIANEVAEVIGNAEVKVVEKANGVSLVGIIVRDDESNVAPTVYIDEMVEDGYTVNEIAEKVKRIAEEHKVPSMDIGVVTDWDFAKTHLRARLYNKSTSAEISKSAKEYGFDDLIIVPYLELGDIFKDGAVKVTQSLFDEWNVSLDEVFEVAEENSRQEVKVQTMAEIMAEMMGVEIPTDDDTPQMHVVTCDSKAFGAYGIIPLLDYFREKFPKGFAVLPSSVHEVIVTDSDDPSLDSMVQDVNDTQVRLEEQLSDHAYRFVA